MQVCRLLRRMSVCAVITLSFAAASAFAAPVGTITIDTYTSDQPDNTSAGQSGATITAHYNISNNAALTACCDPANLRWLQLVTSSTATGFTPTPNRPFIDPRTGQNIGSGVGDGLPWYDVTYPDNTLTTINNGLGPYIYDQPRVNNTRAVVGTDYSFLAQTLLVCLYDNASDPKKLTILGGFQWGFTITNNGGAPATYTTSIMAARALADAAAIRTAFNTALTADFPGYQVVTCTGTNCENVTFTFVPEPSTWLLLCSGIVFLIVRSTRRTSAC
jgi:hypothetical protein